MSHVPYDEARRRLSHVTYEWVMSHESCHVWMSHVPWVMSHMNESCPIRRSTTWTLSHQIRHYKYAMLHMKMSDHMRKVRSTSWVSAAASSSMMHHHSWCIILHDASSSTGNCFYYGSALPNSSPAFFLVGVVWHMHIHKCDMSRMNGPCHVRMSCVTYKWAMSYINESCHIRMSVM